jgi:hypothetical protein
MKQSPQLSSSPAVTVFSIQAHGHRLLDDRAVEEVGKFDEPYLMIFAI